MDTKYMNELPQSIEKLLSSSNREDIILGLIWCNKHKGKTWCLNNFIYTYGHSDYKYHTRNYSKPDRAEILDFGDYKIIIGGVTLEAYEDLDKYEDETIIIYTENN